MKKYGILMLAGGLLAMSAGFAHAQQDPATATTSTTTTVDPQAATTTTTTDTTVKAPAVPPNGQLVVVPKPRDAITGKVVDQQAPAEKEKSLRDEVREKIKDEAGGN